MSQWVQNLTNSTLIFKDNPGLLWKNCKNGTTRNNKKLSYP